MHHTNSFNFNAHKPDTVEEASSMFKSVSFCISQLYKISIIRCFQRHTYDLIHADEAAYLGACVFPFPYLFILTYGK